MLQIPKIINENFYSWFGKSKIIDGNGKEQICYHKSRTVEPFLEFLHHLGYKNDYNQCYGFYFVAEYHKSYIDYIGNGIEFYVFIKMENPFYFYDNGRGDIKDMTNKKHDYIEITKPFCENLESQGYDGIIILCESNYNQYVVWHGNQIKSIDNNGSYSSEINNIYS